MNFSLPIAQTLQSTAKNAFHLSNFKIIINYELKLLNIFLFIGVCVMSYRKLTEARTANGTDEDLIFVFIDG